MLFSCCRLTYYNNGLGLTNQSHRYDLLKIFFGYGLAKSGNTVPRRSHSLDGSSFGFCWNGTVANASVWWLGGNCATGAGMLLVCGCDCG